MAIRPEKLLEKLGKDAESQVNRLEREIDDYLKANFEGEAVFVPITEYPNAYTAKKIKEKYRAAGWTKTQFHSDQRDGDYFELGFNLGKQAEDFYSR
jgi:sugar-specific transcriptional regulator TrmB